MNKYVRATHQARANQALELAKKAKRAGNTKQALMAMKLYHHIQQTWLKS